MGVPGVTWKEGVQMPSFSSPLSSWMHLTSRLFMYIFFPPHNLLIPYSFERCPVTFRKSPYLDPYNEHQIQK